LMAFADRVERSSYLIVDATTDGIYDFPRKGKLNWAGLSPDSSSMGFGIGLGFRDVLDDVFGDVLLRCDALDLGSGLFMVWVLRVDYCGPCLCDFGMMPEVEVEDQEMEVRGLGFRVLKSPDCAGLRSLSAHALEE
ncbi:MAG TPA: hypothetical protein VI729_08960, partial [Anaerolineales bacterium]|nr:hypothetical protein [Anaerolineales bacterium]